MNSSKCPLITSDPETIRDYLSALPLDEIITVTEDVFHQLSPAEKISFDINRFCSDYSNVRGRIAFLEALIEHSVISMVALPVFYRRDKRLTELMRPRSYEYFVPLAAELAAETPALTDQITPAPAATITISPPRWEHVDETRAEESPDAAAAGDKIALLADVTGYPEGAPVVFDIFDASTEPAMRIETERGRNEGGTARIEWTITDPNGRGDALKLQFEASARNKSSGKVPLKTIPEIFLPTDGYEVLLLDDREEPLEGIKISFTIDGTETIVPTDNRGVAALAAQNDSPAEVKILWNEGSGADADAGIGTPQDQAEDIDPDPDSIEIVVTDQSGAPEHDGNIR